MAVVRVPRKGVTQAELTTVLSRRLGGGYEVESNGDGLVIVRRSSLSTAVVRIRDVPGATVFRVRGGGLPVYRMGTTRRVADAIRRSPEFRSVLSGALPTPGGWFRTCGFVVIPLLCPRAIEHCVAHWSMSSGAILMPANLRP